ncbi:hypothetical protein BC940DRAFT_319217 [Gongronella butleri]|nr:hypothetical protein BC940DRAFT_319217 [Gongronella butleri]
MQLPNSYFISHNLRWAKNPALGTMIHESGGQTYRKVFLLEGQQADEAVKNLFNRAKYKQKVRETPGIITVGYHFKVFARSSHKPIRLLSIDYDTITTDGEDLRAFLK